MEFKEFFKFFEFGHRAHFTEKIRRILLVIIAPDGTHDIRV